MGKENLFKQGEEINGTQLFFPNVALGESQLDGAPLDRFRNLSHKVLRMLQKDSISILHNNGVKALQLLVEAAVANNRRVIRVNLDAVHTSQQLEAFLQEMFPVEKIKTQSFATLGGASSMIKDDEAQTWSGFVQVADVFVHHVASGSSLGATPFSSLYGNPDAAIYCSKILYVVTLTNKNEGNRPSGILMWVNGKDGGKKKRRPHTSLDSNPTLTPALIPKRER